MRIHKFEVLLEEGVSPRKNGWYLKHKCIHEISKNNLNVYLIKDLKSFTVQLPLKKFVCEMPKTGIKFE